MLLFLLILSILNFSFSSVLIPTKGTYEVLSSSHDDTCPQYIEPQLINGELIALKVVYVGACYYIGPYTYNCDENRCGNESIFFEFKSSSEYYWENKDWDIWGYFKLK